MRRKKVHSRNKIAQGESKRKGKASLTTKYVVSLKLCIKKDFCIDAPSRKAARLWAQKYGDLTLLKQINRHEEALKVDLPSIIVKEDKTGRIVGRGKRRTGKEKKNVCISVNDQGHPGPDAPVRNRKLKRTK